MIQMILHIDRYAVKEQGRFCRISFTQIRVMKQDLKISYHSTYFVRG